MYYFQLNLGILHFSTKKKNLRGVFKLKNKYIFIVYFYIRGFLKKIAIAIGTHVHRMDWSSRSVTHNKCTVLATIS